jgi:type VI secretion system secreted protein VgrG
MSLTQDNRIAAIESPLGKDVLCLASLSGHEELGRLFQYEVELLSENHNVKFEDIIGHNVTVRLNSTRNNNPRYFNGIISRFTQQASTSHYASYRATIVPWFWFLTRTSDCRIWSGSDKTRTVPEIIKELFNVRGFKDFEDKLSGNYTPWDFCVQYRETDFNFLSRIMEQEGIYYYFKHTNGKHTLVLADSMDAHHPFPSYDEIHYQPQGSGSSDVEHIRDWTLNKELFTGKYVHKDFDFENPRKDLSTEPAIKKREHGQADFEIYDYPGEFTKPDDGKEWAKIRIEELQSRHHLLHGSADARGLAAGCTFDLKKLPREDQNQKYLVVSVAHSLRIDGYESGGGSSGGKAYHCSFTVLPGKEVFRPARITPKPLIQGPQTAIVVGPKGEEIHTDEYGRVKLQFHWDRHSKSDEKSSCWVRVSHASAGKGWGSINIPRMGQEVIVEFLEGDPDLPIITGCVYNKEQAVPYKLPDEKTKSTIKSNTSKGGEGFNEIRFEDAKGKEQVFIHGEHDMDVRVKNDTKERIYGNHHHIVGWEKDGAKGGDQREMVYQDKHLKVHRNQIEQIGDSMQLLIGGVDSGQGNQDIVLKGVKKESIEKDSNLHVKGKRNEKVDGDQSLTIGGKQQEKVGTNHALEAGQEIHLKAGMKVIIEAGMQLTLKGPGGFVDIGPAGVTISGSMVLINSGGAAGSGSGSSPTAPEDAKEAAPTAPAIAADAKSGQKSARS